MAILGSSPAGGEAAGLARGGGQRRRLRLEFMRYVALDLGEKRTGVAVGDSITGVAVPVDVIEVGAVEAGGESLLRAIEKVVEEQLGPRTGRGGAGEIVIGLPLNMDGSEGPRSRSVRALAGRIAERTGRAVHLQDERLTSAAADWSMARTGLTRKQKKARRDAIAAAELLRDFLVRVRGTGAEGEVGDED
jgi:putative holliday junction resolvase